MTTTLSNCVLCLVPTLKAFARLRIASLLTCLVVSPAFSAGPSGGTVSAGSASISQSAAQTTIKQTSDKAVVNWSNFSIGSGSTVRFVQPSASSIALNRVTGTQASVIQGALQANGQVWVLNPNGVLIAPGGQVATGSFLATTRSLTDQQFMAGNYAFTDGGVPGASVVNQGSIILADGGYAVLAGEAVRNEGYIEANLGQVVLGGAKAFTLDLSGDNTLAFVVTAPVDVSPTDGKAVVDNSGSIQAAGGRVLITARAASQVVGQVINNGGVVAATSAQMVNGKIVLDGGTGSVSVAGDLNASGKGAGQTGGAIDVNAQKIQVKATAKLDVSGDAGGGKIAIGGGGPNTRTQSFTPAVSTTIASSARLDASAVTRGDGGEILVFTSLTNPVAFTQVAGSLIARGGAQGGNGGFIETSGYRLDVSGIVVSTNAPKGRLGLWLLDPDSIEIGAFETTGGCTATDMTGVGCTRLDAAALIAALNGGELGSPIKVSATNSILVSAPISWSSSGTLTLEASGASGVITVNAAITNTGLLGGLTLSAKTIDIKALISLGTGSLIVNDKGAVAGSRFTLDVPGDEGSSAAGINIQAATVEIKSAMVATTSISITNASSVTIGGRVEASTITVNAPSGVGTITVEQPMVSRDTLELNAGTSISVTTNELTSNNPGEIPVLGTTTLTAPQITFGANLTQTGNLTATATTSISFGAAERITFEGDGTKLLIAPEIIWGAQAMLGNGSLTLQTSQLTWLAGGSYTGFAGGPLIIGGGGVAKTTITSPEDISLTASNITISNEVAWSGFGLILSPQISPGTGNLNVNKMTGTGGASLVITTAATLNAAGTGLIALSGTPAPGKVASFTYSTSEADVGPETTSRPGAGGGVTVTVTNTAGGGGGSAGSGSSDTPAAVVTPTTTTTSTTAAVAAAKAAADAAAAKAVADAAAAQAAALGATTTVVVEQAITQAVATVVASTSAAVFVAPPPPPPATTTTSSASTTTSTDATAASSSASTTTTTTSTTTAATATTTTTATTTSAAPSTTVTQEFVEPLSVTTLSSTTSASSDPGDASASTTSTASGPASQTATPASTATAAPAAPSLTPVAVSKDGADAGDFTLQTVKPPAPVTTAKQEARPTERVTITPVSPGIALQATQKTSAPSGSVLGREISGSGNSSNW